MNMRLKQELERFQREEREAEQEAIAKQNAPAAREIAASVVANTRKLKNYWRRPIQDVAKDFVAQFFFPDLSLVCATTATPQPNAGQQAYTEFLERLTLRTGYCLNSVGQHRLGYFGVSLAVTQNADTTSQDFWQMCFSRLVSIDAFNDGGSRQELGFDESLKTEVEPTPQAQEQRKSFDEVLAENDTFSRSGRAAIEAAAMQELQGTALVWFSAFRESIRQNFQHVLTESEVAAIVEFMKRHGLNFQSAADWDRARLGCRAALLLPKHLIYPVEALSEAVESTTVPLDSYSARQDFIRRSRLIRAAQERQ